MEFELKKKSILSVSFALFMYSVGMASLITFIAINIVFFVQKIEISDFNEVFLIGENYPLIYGLTKGLFLTVMLLNLSFLMNYVMFRKLTGKTEERFSASSMFSSLGKNAFLIYVIGIVVLVCLYTLFCQIKPALPVSVLTIIMALISAVLVSMVVTAASGNRFKRYSANYVFVAALLGAILAGVCFYIGVILVMSIIYGVHYIMPGAIDILLWFLLYAPIGFIGIAIVQYFSSSLFLNIFK